jgi:phospholipid/cholesterol/gamma-HCH transport system ATP-binding protein
MIEVSDLSVSFSSTPVFSGIACSVPTGTTSVVIGKNGSGKSVFLKAIAGLLPYKGSISVGGQRPGSDLYAAGGEESVLAYVFQKGGLFDSMNVFENAAFGMRRRHINEDFIVSTVSSVLDRVGLKGSELKLPSELSGGMQKRVGLARALCLNPSYILYDDPTAGLDPVLTDSIADLLLLLKAETGVTSIVVTHDMKFAGKIADSVLILNKGSFVFNGSGEEFLSELDPFARQFLRGETAGPVEEI